MESGPRQRKVVGVYDRPASADRKRGPWVWLILAVLVLAIWVAYFWMR